MMLSWLVMRIRGDNSPSKTKQEGMMLRQQILCGLIRCHTARGPIFPSRRRPARSKAVVCGVSVQLLSFNLQPKWSKPMRAVLLQQHQLCPKGCGRYGLMQPSFLLSPWWSPRWESGLRRFYGPNNPLPPPPLGDGYSWGDDFPTWAIFLTVLGGDSVVFGNCCG